MIILSCVIILSGALSYIIPRGSYQKDENGVIILDSYVEQGVEGIEIWRVITAPVRVFASEDGLTVIVISIFLLIMSGVFNLLEKTNGIKIFIGRLMKKLSRKKLTVVFACVLVFMLFGSFFGMFEELVTLVPLIVMFMIFIELDTMVGLGVCMIGACFGFSSAITNPFSVGLASQMANVNVMNGAWLRVLFFVLIYGVLCGFLYLYIRKIKKNPELSLCYAQDNEKREKIKTSSGEKIPNSDRILKVYSVFFVVQGLLLVLIASIRAISDLAIPILAVSFLIGGIVSGILVTEKKSDTFKYLLQGAKSMLPAVVMIAFASSVKLIITESGIIDTIMYDVIKILDGKSKFLTIVLIYFLILFLQLFIGSASAKIMLVMPIVLPICQALGISPAALILAYCMADGFTDVILPTNPVLLIGLSMVNVPYSKWIKWTWKLQLFVFSLTILVLFFAVSINY